MLKEWKEKKCLINLFFSSTNANSSKEQEKKNLYLCLTKKDNYN